MRDDDDALEHDVVLDDETPVEEPVSSRPDGEEADGEEPDREEPDRDEPDGEEPDLDEPGPEQRIGSRERAVREEEERRGVPRTATTGDPTTDVRQPGDAAITDLEADPGEDPSLPEELRRGPFRPPPTGRTPPDDEPNGGR